MSNSTAPRSIQAPLFSAHRFPWPGQDCALCGTASGDAVICVACDAALPKLEMRCDRCAVPLPMAGTCGQCQRHAPVFDSALAVFEYRFPVDRVIHRFKYSGDLAMGRWLALRLLDRVRCEPLPDLVVAPPLTAARLRERGFNQAIEIAKVVAKGLGMRCALAGLAKVRETSPQPALGRRQRRANLRDAFRCDLELEGRHVALVDDVVTTGATADALARVLKAAGAASVGVWAVARTPDPAED
jgi:ComF family protein